MKKVYKMPSIKVRICNHTQLMAGSDPVKGKTYDTSGNQTTSGVNLDWGGDGTGKTVGAKESNLIDFSFDE